jgi:hypothetical protein
MVAMSAAPSWDCEVNVPAESLILRDQGVPGLLVVVRLGVNTLGDRLLADACERTHARWGIWGFSVLEVPGGDYHELARLRPIVAERRQLLEADGHELAGAGFPLFPTLDYPHWTVVLSEQGSPMFARVRELFRGPIENPSWVGRSGSVR